MGDFNPNFQFDVEEDGGAGAAWDFTGVESSSIVDYTCHFIRKMS